MFKALEFKITNDSAISLIVDAMNTATHHFIRRYTIIADRLLNNFYHDLMTHRIKSKEFFDSMRNRMLDSFEEQLGHAIHEMIRKTGILKKDESDADVVLLMNMIDHILTSKTSIDVSTIMKPDKSYYPVLTGRLFGDNKEQPSVRVTGDIIPKEFENTK